MSEETLVVFTFKSIGTLLRLGGTGSWRLDRARARRCTFVVCTRNAKDARSEGPEHHRQGFLVGRVSEVVPAPDEEGDFLVEFSEYALIKEDDVWKGDRNPVRYASIEDLKIDFDKLDWQPMPARHVEPAETDAASQPRAARVQALTMSDAKKGLALTFGVAPEAIEITIRG
jgi:hypothetical protein